MTNETSAAQEWAKTIRAGSRGDGVERILLAVNLETHTKRANVADVVVACAQMLGQTVSAAGPDIAAEIRQGIMAMIDGYAMEVSLGE